MSFARQPRSLIFSALILALFWTPHAAAGASAVDLTSMESAIVDLTNQERFKQGLPELKPNPQLSAAARKHAANMAAQNELEHKLDGKTHSDRISDAGYAWISARENIAFNQDGAREVLEAWMKSPGHRENILAKDVAEIGVGISADAKGELYFCQDFALPQSAALTFRFSVKNSSGLALTVDTGTPKPTTIPPGDTITYTLTTADAEPEVKLSAGEMNPFSFKLENAAAYRIEKNGADFKLLKIEK